VANANVRHEKKWSFQLAGWLLPLDKSVAKDSDVREMASPVSSAFQRDLTFARFPGTRKQ